MTVAVVVIVLVVLVVSIAVVSVMRWRLTHKARTAHMIPMQMSALEVSVMGEAKEVSCVM